MLNSNVLKQLLLSSCILFCSDVVQAEEANTRTISIGTFVENTKERQVYLKDRSRFIHSMVFEMMGYQLRLVNRPYLRSLQLANAGELDGTVIFKLKNDADLYGHKLELVGSSKPHQAASLDLYTKKGNATEILKGITSASIGIMRSLPNAKEYLNSIGIDPHIFKDYSSLFHVLEAGRVDAIILPSFIYKSFIAKGYNQDDFEYVKSIGCLESYMAFSVKRYGSARANELADEHGDTIGKLWERNSDIFYFDC
jgi:hypothetical protein